MHFVFGRLYSFCHSHHGSVWLLPVISLLLTYTVSQGCGLAYSYSWRGVVLLVYYSFIRQVEDGISALYLFDDSPSCDVYLGVEHHHQMIGSNRAHVRLVFCCLYPFSPSHHGSGWLLSVIPLLLTYTVSRVQACLFIFLERFQLRVRSF